MARAESLVSAAIVLVAGFALVPLLPDADTTGSHAPAASATATPGAAAQAVASHPAFTPVPRIAIPEVSVPSPATISREAPATPTPKTTRPGASLRPSDDPTEAPRRSGTGYDAAIDADDARLRLLSP